MRNIFTYVASLAFWGFEYWVRVGEEDQTRVVKWELMCVCYHYASLCLLPRCLTPVFTRLTKQSISLTPNNPAA